ncbi:AsmA family protein [Roseobacter denitrificans]|uniref:AsmA family protein n=1 Tax=Roseobacter denitrificans (strain ATCC 33942 / OCh 114) TaxID=375451 RepID=Q169Q8_ROSDO|nr:AsmA family protein [Roseobacter denitrificans]ABG31285.1 AsmA family protein [Roseobacter denitrificans OCh 114]AVL54330.1 AsmA family protein [Roseobacter denitrificans]SFF99012.1 AsmA protein [Roseobacter denitrificans OCh 114]
MKWVFRFFGLIFALVVLLVVTVFFLPADRLARIATEQLSATTGRDVAINGDVALTFWPVLGVSANDLEVGNAAWAEQGPMLQAANAAIGVDVMALLRGDIRITNVEAHSPTIRLEQRLDGRASWEFTNAEDTAQITTSTDASTDAPAAMADESRTISIERLSVTNATLVYDAEGSDLVTLAGVDLALDWPDPGGPAEISATVRPADVPVRIAAQIEGFGDFIAGETRGVNATVAVPSGELSLDGRASTAGAVAGAVSFSAGNTEAFLAALGLPGIALPPKLGAQIDMRTDLTLTPDRQLALRDLVLDLHGNRLTGAADVSLNGTPNVNVQLAAGDLDLRPVQTASGSSGSSVGQSGAEPASDGWSKSPIDASALASFNGDIALSANSIDLGQFKLGTTQTVLRNDNSRMVFELRQVSAYGGQVTGEFVVNNRSGLSVGGRMNVAGMQMQPLLKDAVEFDRLTGQGDVQLSFLGAGNSVHAIMNSLSGNGGLNIARGTIEGINLDQLLRGGASSGTTIFDDLSATWNIKDGVLRNDDLLLQLKNYSASGEGQIGLGKRTLNYTVTPIALRANSGNGVAIPVRFRGPWSDVSITPDLEAALDLNLDQERRDLEDRAKSEVSERLGIKQEEGKSTEDAIKDKVKDELLRKLFD